MSQMLEQQEHEARAIGGNYNEEGGGKPVELRVVMNADIERNIIQHKVSSVMLAHDVKAKWLHTVKDKPGLKVNV